MLGFSFFSYAQGKKFKISASVGSFNGGKFFTLADNGTDLGLDVSYFVSDRFLLTFLINCGEDEYYEDKLSNYPQNGRYDIKGNLYNATLRINNVGLLAGYSLPLTPWANIIGQAGISEIIKMSMNYPMLIYRETPGTSNLFIEDVDDVGLSVAFPVKFNAEIEPFKNLNLGLIKNLGIGYTFGFYISPDFGFYTGIYHGPQLSISF